MSDACNFALDVQELMQGQPTTENAEVLWGFLRKYDGIIQGDNKTIEFPDGSNAVWDGTGFQLIEMQRGS